MATLRGDVVVADDVADDGVTADAAGGDTAAFLLLYRQAIIFKS